MSDNTTTLATIPLSFNSRIEVYPWEQDKSEPTGPRSPVLVVQTPSGELRFAQSTHSGLFSVRAAALTLLGLKGVTMGVFCDEQKPNVFCNPPPWNPARIPTWSTYGSERRSDGRPATVIQRQRAHAIIEQATAQSAREGAFQRLAAVTDQWAARKRLVEIETALVKLGRERAAVATQIAPWA